MDEQQKSPAEEAPAFYALERTKELGRTIENGIQKMLICRAKVEKHRLTNLSVAQTAYEDLVHQRDKLLTNLKELQLTLLELEDHKLATMAGKLHGGLAGFPLMSNQYKPVYEGFMAFLKRLPTTDETTNAAVIGRLMNSVKMGYYPTDPGNIDLLLDGIVFPDSVTTNLLDPCCGCGKALRQLAEGNNCYTYAVELDENRAMEAQTRLHRVGIGSFFYSRISREAFHLLFLNPPYLSVLGQGNVRSRHEKRFLVDSLHHLMMGGLLIYIIPFYRLTADICHILSDNFEDLSVWKFTEDEFKKFKQVAVLGRRKKRMEDGETAELLERFSLDADTIPLLSTMESERYALPAKACNVPVFKGERFNQAELARQLQHSNGFDRLLARSHSSKEEKSPLLPLSIGQIGLIGGSGLINGLVDCATPHIIKGRIVKVRKEETTEQYTNSGVHAGAQTTEVISNKMIFNILTPEGFRSLA